MSEADIRSARHAERRTRMDVDFRRSIGDFDSLVRGRFKRRLPEVEALPRLIRGACRVLEGGGMKPFTDFVVDPQESIPDALARFATDSSVRLRPVSQEEQVVYPPPWPVQAVPPDRCVRLHQQRPTPRPPG